LKIDYFEIEKEIKGNKYFKKLENDLFIKFYYRANLPQIFDTPLKRELRGITFAKENKSLVARPFHKFFNLNEYEESKEENLHQDKYIFREKLDGTLIYFAKYKGKLYAFTQRRFENEYTQEAWEILRKNKKLLDFINKVTEKNYTPLFELISPKYKIVIPYETSELILTEIRDNISGKYILEKIEDEIKELNIKLPKKYIFSLKEAKKFIENKENIEGLVLKEFSREKPFPIFVKLKSPWYLKRHYATSYLRNIPNHKLFLLHIQNKFDDIIYNVSNKELIEKRLKDIKPYINLYEDILKKLEEISLSLEKCSTWKEKRNFLEIYLDELLKDIRKKYKNFQKLEIPKELLRETVYAILNKSNYEENFGLKFYALLKGEKIKYN